MDVQTKRVEATFDKTVGILVNAYMKGTLQHTNCYACAVGNIVAAACGNEIISNGVSMRWKNLESGSHWYNNLLLHRGRKTLYGGVEILDEGLQQIEATGYTVEEIHRIERAFETELVFCMNDGDGDTDGYKGLMAVVDVLADIHGVDLTVREEAKALFVK